MKNISFNHIQKASGIHSIDKRLYGEYNKNTLEYVRGMMEKTNKCNNCGGDMAFNVEWQNLKCTHCGSSVSFDIIRAPFIKKDYKTDSVISNEFTQYTEYVCQTCSRRHIVKRGESFEHCPTCGDQNLVKVLKVDYKPDGIIPFQINKETAVKKFFDWVRKRKLSPNMLKLLDRTQKLVGMYVPAYYYDFHTTSNFSGVGVKNYRDKEGRTRQTRHRFNDVRRDEFYNQIESAGQEVPTSALEKISSFDTSKLCVYSSEYLYGWAGAEVTSFLQENYKNMTNYMSSNIANKIKHSLPYDYVEDFHCVTMFSNVKYNYVYLPVYKGTYRYKDKTYTYYINGDSGEVTGKSPKSFWKIFGVAILLALGIAGVALLLYLLSK